MNDIQFQREELLIGKENLLKLHNAKVAIYGIGGVGSYVCEALARAGIGSFLLVDFDRIDITNLNRQIHATYKTVGEYKVDAMKERILEINPDAQVNTVKEIPEEEKEEDFINSSFDYIVDAVDTVSTKLKLILKSDKEKVPIISSMGTGNKLDPTQFKVSSIKKTKVCPLAKVIRKELKDQKIEKLKVVYSEEEPIKTNNENNVKRVPGSISFVPSTAGLIIAGEVIKDIIRKTSNF